MGSKAATHSQGSLVPQSSGKLSFKVSPPSPTPNRAGRRELSNAADSGGTLPQSRQRLTSIRRRGHCEVVIIEGAGGLGKSTLAQQVLAEAKRKGYCATSKFDTARRTAFGPLLKLVSSLFRQVFVERNTESPLHMALRDYVHPIWPMLHILLGLPEHLFGPFEPMVSRSTSAAQSPSNGLTARGSLKRRGSSPGSSPASQSRSPRVCSQTSQDLLRSGASTKTIRLMNTFLDILRIFTTYHFICFVLDDLHYGDDESMELITQMIAARLKMVVIMTYRPEEISPEKVMRIVQPADSEGMSLPSTGLSSALGFSLERHRWHPRYQPCGVRWRPCPPPPPPLRFHQMRLRG